MQFDEQFTLIRQSHGQEESKVVLYLGKILDSNKYSSKMIASFDLQPNQQLILVAKIFKTTKENYLYQYWMADLQKEIKTFKQFEENKYIVKLVDYGKGPYQFFSKEQEKERQVLIFEKMEGSLMHLMEIQSELIKNTQAQPQKILSLLKNIIECYKPLYQKNLVHKNLRPTKFLFWKQGLNIRLKLGDIGVAKNLRILMEGNISMDQKYYMAPQHLDKFALIKTIDSKIDVFSIGIIFAELIIGKRLLYWEQFQYSTLWRMNQKEFEIVAEKLKSEQINQDLANLIINCIAIDRENRYNFAKLQHEFNKIVETLKKQTSIIEKTKEKFNDDHTDSSKEHSKVTSLSDPKEKVSSQKPSKEVEQS